MSNTIELAKSFVPKLDECYRLASLTSVLDGAPELAKQGANANELIIPMMSMQSLTWTINRFGISTGKRHSWLPSAYRW